MEALEQRAKLDPNRLPRGRDYAASGAVGDLVFAPGEARARVQGRKTAPYEIKIRVRRFDDDEWGRVLDSISTQLGRAAALLDGELPPEVADDVAAAGLGLLPGPGEVGPRCSCPDDADPCKHSAAVCYLLADALDADPFVVFLLRGRTRAEVLAGLRSRRRGVEVRAEERGIRRTPAEDGTRPAGEAGRDLGVDTRAALGRASRSGPIPIPPLPPARPGIRRRSRPRRRRGAVNSVTTCSHWRAILPGERGSWPAASAPTAGSSSTSTPTSPGGPTMRSAHGPSRGLPSGAESTVANWPEGRSPGVMAARPVLSCSPANGIRSRR